MRVSFGKQIKKLSKEEYFNLVKSGDLENIKNSFQKKEIKAPNETDDENQNVLFAMMIELQNDEKCLNILKYLCLEQHIDPSIMDNNQQNLLFYSCAEGLLECTKFGGCIIGGGEGWGGPKLGDCIICGGVIFGGGKKLFGIFGIVLLLFKLSF